MRSRNGIISLVIVTDVLFLCYIGEDDWKPHIKKAISYLGEKRSSFRNGNSQTYRLHNKTLVENSDWKTMELERLADLVQRRLIYLQNPKNCDTAKKILCTLPHNMDLNNIDNIQIIRLPRNVFIRKRPKYLPLSIPEDLADNLTRAHKNPSGWWIGQFLIYLTRKNQDLTHFVEKGIRASSNFRNPVVGIHVRRTDKGIEAQLHNLSEYMNYVDEWFDKYEKSHRDVHRKVFLASDDAQVATQARESYPKYTFITNTNASVMAQSKKTRYSESSLRGLLLDIEMLSKCDFVVCTLTSSVGRLVYELMHARYWDAPSRIKSLDVDYSFHRKFFRTPETLETYRRKNDGKRFKVFTNITTKQGSQISLDNEKLRVRMPTYPEVSL